MNRRRGAALLGGAAVVTIAVLVVISLILDRVPSPTATSPGPTVTSPVPSPGTDPPVVGESAGVSTTPPVYEESEPGPDAGQSGGGDASPGSIPYSRTDVARRQWEPVVVGFGRSFTRTSGQDATDWRGGLDRYVTTAVQRQLRTVDPGNVPSGTYASFEVDSYDEEAVTAKVTYREGWALILYVIHDGERWRIYRYDRWDE